MFTKVNGSTGLLADAAFRTGEQQRTEQAVAVAATMAVLIGSPDSLAQAPIAYEGQTDDAPEAQQVRGFDTVIVQQELATNLELTAAADSESEAGEASGQARVFNWSDNDTSNPLAEIGVASDPTTHAPAEAGEAPVEHTQFAFDSAAVTDSALMEALLMFAQQSGDATAQPGDQLVVAVAVQDALGEAMVESLLADFAAMDSTQATDIPMRSEGHEFAALLDANIGIGEIQVNIVPISDVSDESSMALAVNG